MLVHEGLRIYQIRLPLPFRLNHVNSYAIKGQEGWWLVDTGLNTEPSRQVWQRFMKEENIAARDVLGIYITHAHPDHFGAAGWLQGLTQAPVFISTVDKAAVDRIWRDKSQKMVDAVSAMFKANGMPAPITKEATLTMHTLAAGTDPLPRFSTLEGGSRVRLGDFEYRTILTPGHADGHICYLNEEFGLLLSGDHLLPKITSNISLWPGGSPDPLADYLQSLRDSLRLPVELDFPAHGQPFKNVRERIHELLTHHQERLNLMKGLVSGETTVYTVCRQVFGDALSAHEVRFAMAETAAHLVYMVHRGELVAEERESVFRYRKSS
ncbi:Metallo-beta-lactamase superfamily [Acididesulfobacillus acetoxydans]|uniref:Beta-lactamase domain-containing protein n=1 Tax=Acididesulfobacillus acetoxydans TaxID=1561005 RepID=A0A8S0W320_9FIRM|nr:MBL fold metallo-hydrolase [Acididesulfobacillus acetoxydans]CAA7601228.1 Metallo-beta-lactamase superfamily [Acididesulfobacillus acetoxydans]CEJ08493.1 Beta-lactamase domain-containing protein [Acididesulfobacillus acetoxydans]